MTAGLVVEDEISGRRSHGALDMVAAQVAACFEEHHRDAPDVVVPLARIHAGTVGIRPHRSRTRPLVFAGAASALALVGVLAVRVWPDEPVPQGSPAASAAVSILPAAPPGTRLVGYADVAVAVPDDWGHNAVSCNGEPQDSVIYPDAAVTERCAVDPRVSTVAFTNPTSAAMYYSSIHPPVIDRIDGDKVLGTALNRTHGVYEQTVVVPSSGFLMVVRSPRQSVVRDVVGSVRVVPEGFTVVPACGGQRLGDAFAALLAAGLKPAVNRVSTASERLGQPPVKYQDVDSGQLVPVGSEVALFVPSS